MKKQIELLEKMSLEISNAGAKIRCQAVSLKLQGWTDVDIADELGCGAASLRRWMKVFQHEGIDVLCSGKRVGRKPLVSSDQKISLAKEFKANIGSWKDVTVSTFQNFLRGKGVHASHSTAHTIMQSMDIAYMPADKKSNSSQDIAGSLSKKQGASSKGEKKPREVTHRNKSAQEELNRIDVTFVDEMNAEQRSTYPTDLTDEQWALIEPHIPLLKPGGRPFKYPRREIVNAILYVVRAGCSWRMLPHDFPDWQDVYHYFSLWREEEVWPKVNAALREKVRTISNRNLVPTAAIMDTQSVKTTDRGGTHGYDGAKKVNGRKRQIVTDTLGLLLSVLVHSATLNDRSTALAAINSAKMSAPQLEIVWADQGYRSDRLFQQMRDEIGVRLEIVGRPRLPGAWTSGESLEPDGLETKGFRLQKRRWVVERTFGWLNRYRRLSKDYEYRTDSSESMIYAAMIGNMARSLTRV